MKYAKRLSALFLVLAIVLALMPMTAFAATEITEAQVKANIEQAKITWRAGRVWNNDKNWGAQCWGFARRLFYDIFGTTFPNGGYDETAKINNLGGVLEMVDHLEYGAYNASTLTALLATAKCGDVLVVHRTRGQATKENRPYTGHIMIIIGINLEGAEVIVHDANWGCNNGNVIKIRPYKAANISNDFAQAATLYRYTGYSDDATQPPSDSVVTSGEVYAIVPKCAPNSCLDVQSKSTANSANVQIWENCHTTNQQWKVESVGGGYYKFVPQHSGRALDVAGQGYKTGAEKGTNVQQYDYTATHNAQKWKLEDAEDGYYYIIPKVNESLCLDVSGGSSKNGTNVQTWTRNYTDAQKWKLVPVNCTTHSWGNWIVTKDPNCEVKGEKLHTCTRCGEVQIQSINALGHNYKKTSSTSTKDVYTCANCGRSYDDVKQVAVTSTPKPTPTPTPTPAPTPTPKPTTTWGSWSSWSTTPVSSSQTRQVETKEVEIAPGHTEYRYGRYMAYNGPKKQDTYWCTTYARNRGYASVSGAEYTSWSATRLSDIGKDYTCGFCKGSHIGVHHYSNDGRPWWKTYNTSNGEYYWEESRWVGAQTQTQYRYRDLVTG